MSYRAVRLSFRLDPEARTGIHPPLHSVESVWDVDWNKVPEGRHSKREAMLGRVKQGTGFP